MVLCLEFSSSRLLAQKMSGTDGEDEYKQFEGDGEEDLGLFGDLSNFEGLALEEEAEKSTESGSTCPHCLEKYLSPRVLSCLHVLCETCLKELLVEVGDNDEDDQVYNGSGRNGCKSHGTITCPQCKQETIVIITFISLRFHLTARW